MSTLNSSKMLLLASLLFSWGGRVRAEDLITANGKVFKNVEVRDLDCDSITFDHSDGTSKVPLKDLAVEVQKRYSPNDLLQELRRATDQLKKLDGELADARRQAAVLAQRIENPGLGNSSGNPPIVSVPTKPIPSVASLPPLKEDDTVSVEEILHHYKTDPRSADLRYKKRIFRIQGKVERFEEKAFIRNTAVILESSDRSARVACEVPFPEEFNAVFATKEGRTLIGTTKSRREVRLMEVGEVATFKGKCAGWHNFTIVFSHCERIR